MELLRAKGIKKVYNTKLGAKSTTALSNITLSVAEGEFTAIMGASGSGKTTLMNILSSLDKPSEGDVFLDGRAFSSIPERELSGFRRKHLGFVFQDFNLIDTFTVRDNILLPLVLSKTPYDEMAQRLTPVTELLGITMLLDKFPYEVSGGEKQRTAIARAVITEPRLILADEPTGALDSKASGKLLDAFCELNAQGKTILMVTHSAVAASRSSRVLFIRDGELFSELYKGDDSDRAFFERIVTNLTALGGGDVG